MSDDPVIRVVRQARPALASVPRAAPASPPSPPALALLAEVLARLAGVERPVVQIIGACPATRTAAAAQAFGHAAASRFGRTLLVSCGPGEPARARRVAVRAFTPDVLVDGLHHAHWVSEAGVAPAEAIEKWLAGPPHFRLIAIESQAACADPGALAVAAQCHASVLAVQAGLTPLDGLRASVRQLAGVGALLIGTVLVDAPAARAARRGGAV